jgi:hypothetical protein
MSRKYRQPGYQDGGGSADQGRGPDRPREKREGPRSPKMPGMGRVVRCALCGTRLPSTFEVIALTSQCPQCQADLHSCRNCVFFNPTSRFECEQPIQEQVSPKDRRVNCEFFEIRSTVEKIVTSSRPSSADDPRKAFEDLFKS